LKSPLAAWPAFVVLILALRWCAQEQHPNFEIHTERGQTTFHIGERIALKLRFTSPNDTGYSILTWGFDRDRPNGLESFELNPSSGWADPQATYWAYAGFPPFKASLTPARPFLVSKPLDGSVDLNEWVRFDQPGVYTLKLRSERVSTNDTRFVIPLESNTIELQIVPATPEWQQAQLEAIRLKIDSRNVQDSDYDTSVAALRYLATPGAIEVITAQLSVGHNANACRVGLLGLPGSMHNVAIQSMKKRLNEPDYPITGMFYDTMLVLGLTLDSNKESFQRQVQTANANLLQVVSVSARDKSPAARAETMQTLQEFGEWR